MESRFQQTAGNRRARRESSRKNARSSLGKRRIIVSNKSPHSANRAAIVRLSSGFDPEKRLASIVRSGFGRVSYHNVNEAIRALLDDRKLKRPALKIKITSRLRREFTRALAEAKAHSDNLQSYEETVDVIGQRIRGIQDRLKSKHLING